MATHVYTSVAANYLPKARVLAQSVKKHHPDFKFHVVLCDALPGWFAIEREPFDSVITLDDFALPHPEQWIFKHTLVELSTAVKGFALEKLLALPDCAEVLYFDPDIVVLSSLKRLLDEFAHASILLTPHITQPEDTIEAILDNEFSVLQHGIYNLGFAGVKNSPEGRRFARWWAERLNLFCYDDIPRGIFTDQRWADLVPAYFNDHKILRDPIYNVCTWNLTHRAVTGSLEHGLLVNGQPITFYHFSGFDSGAQQGMLDKYGSGMPALYELREWYIAECERMGQSELAGIPWAYGFFDNGERILNTHRRRYRDRPDLQSAFANPYTTADLSRSYLHWFNRNEEISSPVQKRAETADFPATPDYRVFLIAAAGDAPFLSETLRLVHQRSHCADRISLVAPAAILAETPAPPGTAAVPLELHRYDEMFAEILRRFGDKDALLIRAGAIPPEKWDLRLAWSAVRQPGIATVSPIDERLLDPSGHLRSGVEQNILDRLCYWHRQPTDPEISSFSRECVYVRACALRDVSSLGKQFRPADVLEGSARLRFTHVLATHICVGWRRPRVTDFAILPDATFSAALTRLRDRIRAHADALNSSPPAVVKSMTGPNLHIMHSWGGGLERWVADYCRADRAHDNFVLKSVGPLGSFGAALHLYRDIEDPEPLRVWPIEPAIKASATRHSAYESALSEIVQEYGIRRILVSSLIGHSVDALRQPLDTIFIAHDYYPFCSALNITFDEVCPSCEQPRLAACVQENPHNRFFRNVPPSEWLAIRKEFAGAIKNNAVTLVAPSPSVQRNYARLCPDLPAFHIIPHGTPPLESLPLELDFDPGGPLRVVVLGSLAPQKGGLLLECILPEIVQFCDVTLLGCGAYGTPYTENPSITVIPQYAHKDLAKRIA